MQLVGKLVRDGKFYMVDLGAIGVFTQGRTKKEAYEMAADAIKTIAELPHLTLKITPMDNDQFGVLFNDLNILFGMIIKQARISKGWSQIKLATELGLKSHNSIARYEQFKGHAKLDKVTEILETTQSEAILKIG